MYHYTESGLDNVWLENGYIEAKTPYGKGVSLVEADGLHAALAHEILRKPGHMTGKELRYLRSMLDLSQGGLATTLGVAEEVVSRWERTGKIPEVVEMAVRYLMREKLTTGRLSSAGVGDELGDLQWLPVADNEEKTRVEVKLCRASAR